MRSQLLAIAALVSASAFAVSAQTPQPQPPSQPPAQRPSDPRPGDTTQRTGDANTQAVTVTGCLKAEKDVPGRSPNAAERAGVTEDYILTGVKMAQSSATAGMGLATMYEIEGISEAELKKHLNHQVEITGTLSRSNAQGKSGAAATAGGAASTNADLPELNGTSLKMVSANCTAAQ